MTDLHSWGARAGVAAPILALFAVVVGAPLYADDLSDAAGTARFGIAAAVTLAALLALGLALVALRLEHRVGDLGRGAFAVALCGTVLAAGGAWDSVFTVPYLADEAPAVIDGDTSGSLLTGYVVSYLVFVAGWALFAVALLRARAVPRAAAIVMLAGSVLAILPAPTALRILPLALGVALATRAMLRVAYAEPPGTAMPDS